MVAMRRRRRRGRNDGVPCEEEREGRNRKLEDDISSRRKNMEVDKWKWMDGDAD